MLNTITTIELSNVCNLNCLYCINRHLVIHAARVPGIMTSHVFDRTLDLLAELVLRGTQREVNLNGNGESTLDLRLVKRVRRVKDVMGRNLSVGFCTNGVNMTERLAKELCEAGLDKIDISIHSSYHTRKALGMLAKSGFKYEQVTVALGAVIMSHNWAGQLEPEHAMPYVAGRPCEPLLQGRGYVLKEGNITPCCYDYRNLGVFGDVFDENILDRTPLKFELCNTCHQSITEAELALKMPVGAVCI